MCANCHYHKVAFHMNLKYLRLSLYTIVVTELYSTIIDLYRYYLCFQKYWND